MKVLPILGSMYSGKVRGLVASHNRGGLYFRGRVVPVNPNTGPQVAVRENMRQAVIAWGAATEVVRASWEDYAANVPLTDRLGEARLTTGQNMFVRTYLARSAGGLAMVSTAPVIFNLGDFTPFTGSASAGTDTVSVEFDDTDGWATLVGGFATIALGLQQGPGVNFYKSPFAIKAIVEGAAVPPASPEIIPYGAPLLNGNKIWVKYVVGQADGRVSTPSIFQADVGV